MKENCREFMKCGREPRSVSAEESGVCAAATGSRLDGVHCGRNAGLACGIAEGRAGLPRKRVTV